MLKEDELPIFNWVWFGLYRSEGGLNGYTYGMDVFGKEEMEVLNTDAEPEELRDFLASLASYVLACDVTLQDGETIGFSADDKHTITRSPGVSLPEEQMTLKIGYEPIKGDPEDDSCDHSDNDAVRMNAGTKDDWIGSRVVSVTTFAPDQGLKRYAPSDIEWAYRSTSFAPDEIIVEVELQLTPALSGNIHDKMRTLLERRKASQPLEYPSCGSVFKNPEGASAGALIDEVGLKGSMCGGAQISEKHANFIVNKNKACASDVLALIKRAQEKVKEHYGIELQPEVKFLGFEEEFKS